jgi:hypothetical protein
MMWLATGVAASVSFVLVVVVLAPWLWARRGELEAGRSAAPTALVRDVVVRRPIAAVTAAISLAFAIPVAALNFVAANRLTWGLAFNWTLSLAFAGGLACAAWEAWRRFDRRDWRTVAVGVALVNTALWVLGAMALSLPTATSAEPLPFPVALLLMGLLAWLWVPFIGAPAGLAVGLVVAFGRRRWANRPAPLV